MSGRRVNLQYVFVFNVAARAILARYGPWVKIPEYPAECGSEPPSLLVLLLRFVKQAKTKQETEKEPRRSREGKERAGRCGRYMGYRRKDSDIAHS